MKRNAATKIKDFDIFGSEDTRKTVNRVTPTNEFMEFKKEDIHQSLVARFEEQVRKYSDKIAVVSNKQIFTYDFLNRSANRLAHTIIQKYDDRYKLSVKEKIRYNRQLLLDKWGIESQEKLKSTTVFAAGAGGSGSPVIMQLALLGIGTIIVCDHDQVELSNLNRQFLYDESMIGMNKTLAIKQRLEAFNPHIKIIPYSCKVTRENVFDMVGDAAVIFDNIDDVEAKFYLSECAYVKKIPHIISSMIDLNSYAAIFHPPHTPCFHCLYDRNAVKEIKKVQASENYEKFPNSVASPSLFASTGFAVNEAVKIILGFENPAYKKYFLFNQKGTKDIVNTKGYRQITFPFSEHFKRICKEQGFDWEEVWRGHFVEELDIWTDPDCPLCSGKSAKNFISIEMPAENVTSQDKKDLPQENQCAEGSRQTTALLFRHDANMVVGMLAALKSGKTYVPMDANYPDERLIYMIDDSEARLIVTDSVNFHRAAKLRDKVNRRIPVVNIDEPGENTPGENPGVYPQPDDIVYIMYTSGSTGEPKGVMQNHRNVLHYIKEYTNHLHINSTDRMTQFSSYSFDASVMDIYGALLNGAAVYPFDIKQEGNLYRLAGWLRAERISIYHSVPTVYRYFVDTLTGAEEFPRLRLIVLGGEPVFSLDVEKYKKYFHGDSIFVNLVGSTEASINMLHLINRQMEFTRNAVPLGEAVDETGVYLLDEQDKPARLHEIGEIVFKSDYLSPGYLEKPGKPEKTHEVFVTDSLTGIGRVYRTGDLGRRLTDGSIEYIGRKDFQVKISGYRIELGEIENAMDKIPGIKKSVAICKQDHNGENYLVGYFVKSRDIDLNYLIRSLKQTLPEYMVPGIFMGLDHLPLTRTGKVDRKALPDPVLRASAGAAAPRDQIEEKLAETWAQVLELKKDDISIDANFFELGGQSFKAIILAANIHKKFNVKVSLGEIFDKPTIRELSNSLRGTPGEMFTPIPPAKKKEFYKLSSAQKRLFAFHCIEPGTVIYNLSKILEISGDLDKKRLETVLRSLVMRHESLRTSFEFRDKEPAQVVHDTVNFEIDDYDLGGEERGAAQASQVKGIIEAFIRPFDLSGAPLFRIGLIKRARDHLLLLDMHHIITDGSSMDLLAREFFALYSGQELAPLKLQYKDFAQWQNSPAQQEKMKAIEAFWLKEFEGEIPLLNLPTDFPRPLRRNFQGSMENFVLEKEETDAVKQIAQEHGATVFMVLFAIYNIFLYKITSQTDIIAATMTSGRWHKDLENIIGFFVNFLALRNRLEPRQSFNDFMKDVKLRTLNAFENQNYRLEDLLGKLKLDRDSGRNPLNEIGFSLNNREGLSSGDSPPPRLPDLKINTYYYERKLVGADLIFLCSDEIERIYFNVEYSTELFKKETITGFIGCFKGMVSAVAANPDIKIEEIGIISKEIENEIIPGTCENNRSLEIEFEL